jgi:Spy/CpxP family protein refolding chaperone
MKTIFKRNFALMGVLGLGAVMAFGQCASAETNGATKGEGKQHRGGHSKRGRHMKALKELNLTDAQKTQIKAIMEKSRPQMKALRENTTLDRAAKREQKKAIMQATGAQIRAILTAEQRAKFDTLQAEAKDRRAQRGEGKRNHKGAQ